MRSSTTTSAQSATAAASGSIDHGSCTGESPSRRVRLVKQQALCRLALCAAAALLSCAVLAEDALVAELELRLASAGVESVNEHLSAPANAALLARLNRQTASCNLHAVSLAIRLARAANVPAVQAHQESLRAASGRCTRFVLALTSAAEMPRVCASQAAWGAAQTARELRRRMADIDADKLLRDTVQGQACRAAYLYELKNTRVTLRVAPPRPEAPVNGRIDAVIPAQQPATR